MKIALLTVAGLAAACAAQTSGFVQFDSDAAGAVPNGFVSVDSPLVSFSDIGAGQLQIGNFGGQSDGPSLVNFADTPLRLTFARPVTNLAMLMGDDDSAFLGGVDVFTRIVGYRDGVAVAQRIIQNNGDDLMNDGPSIEGIFDAVQVAFTDAAGVPHAGLPEIIDSVSFAVADHSVDFNSESNGVVPNGFQADDSSLVSFSSADSVSIFQNGTGKTDGPSMINNGSGPIVMEFTRPVTEFSCQVGNDDGVFVGGPVFSTLRGYLGGVLTETVIFANNSNDLMDDGPAIRGVFDRIEFTFTNAAGVVDNGLAEIIDNIAFATASQFLDFESDALGGVPNGFVSADSPIVGFGDTDGSGLQINVFGPGKSDGQSLAVFNDDDSSLRMQFDAIVSTFTIEYGNDDPSREPVFATLRGYNNGTLTRTVTSPTLSDNDLNESVSIAGAFDAIEFQYTNMDGSPVTGGLIEIVDNIRFSVEKQFIDFNDDSLGSAANGFVSNDSNLVSFRDSDGADLQVGDFGTQTDGPGLGVFGDDPSALGMIFEAAANSLTVEFGNDTSSQSTRLRGFLGNVQVAESIVAHDGDDALNQSVTINGFFDRAELVYILNSNGLPANRIELVDNICFDVATGATPCSGADLVAPFGILDLADINAFVAAFTGQTSGGDLNQDGLFDLSDINLFVSSFTSGCP